MNPQVTAKLFNGEDDGKVFEVSREFPSEEQKMTKKLNYKKSSANSFLFGLPQLNKQQIF